MAGAKQRKVGGDEGRTEFMQGHRTLAFVGNRITKMF